MMKSKWRYWKVVCRYGHVGKNKEITVARYLKTTSSANVIDVLKIVSQMPGVKKRKNIMVNSIVEAKCITKAEYTKGLRVEKQNFYVRNFLRNNEIND